MESAAVPAPGAAGRGAKEGDKGLKTGALGYISNVVIGVASTAPGYSLAATLGFITAIVAFHAPAIMLISFVPMLLIAAGFYYLNKADPDCGISFTWVTRAMGPRLGWLTGWTIVAADVVVMAALAYIAGRYSFLLFGLDSLANDLLAISIASVVWIALMTWICWRGIELSAMTQFYLLAAEVFTLALFAIVALVKVYSGDALEGSAHVSLDWFNPFTVPGGWDGIVGGVLLGIFIYWGWDSGVCVNEESDNSSNGPGRAAVASTLWLVLIYVIVATAAVAYAGPGFNTQNSDDVLSALGGNVFGSPLDKLLIIAVLTSASASTQTTILPTARATLAMARFGSIPKAFGRIHPRYLTPDVSTIVMGVVSVIWTLIIINASKNVLDDSVTGVGFLIAFYYGMTGFACTIYFRKELFKSAKNFILGGVAPFLGGLMMAGIFIKSYIDLKPAEANYGGDFLGFGVAVAIGIGLLLIGVVLLVIANFAYPDFFRRKWEVAEPGILEGEVTGEASVMKDPS